MNDGWGARSGKSALRGVCVLLGLLFLASGAHAQSMRFYGYGSAAPDADRVKIAIDNPADNNPGPPADIGATDFTVEFWMRTASGNNASSISCGGNYTWINGNIIFDRDRYNQGRAFGISLGNGRIVFGVQNDSGVSRTICGTTDVRDGQWHHIVVQRWLSGEMELFVDGIREANASGPTGNISYPDNGVPGSFCGGPCTNSDPFIVIGAEKHDVGSSYPAYSGWLTELRLSTVRRYTAAAFAVPTARFDAGAANTAALYRFDEGSGNLVNDATSGSLSPGVRRVGGGPPSGPEWSSESPFTASPGTLRFSTAPQSVGEAVGTVSLTVTRTGGSAGAASVQVGVSSGSATAGSDYQFTPTTLSWANGNNDPQTVVLTILNDADVESNETVVLALSNATGATLGSPASTTVTIIDDDAAPNPGVLQFSTATQNIGEAAGTLSLTVTRAGGSAGAASVQVGVTGGTATAGGDYQFTPTMLNWATGNSDPQTVVLNVVNDTNVEGNETVVLTLSNASGAAIGSQSSMTVTIVDDDAAPSAGVLQFSAATQSVGEAAGTLSLTVTRTGGSAGAASVQVGVTGGTATAGADYQFTPTPLNWANGNSDPQTVVLTVVNDASVEGNETVVLTLSGATGAALGSTSSMTVTIIDDDAAQPPPPSGNGGGGGGGGAVGIYWVIAGLLAIGVRRKRALPPRSH